MVTRDSAAAVLTSVTCAPITRTYRGIRSEVQVGPEQGLSDRSVISCDSLITIPAASLDSRPIGRLGVRERTELDQALRYALDILY